MWLKGFVDQVDFELSVNKKESSCRASTDAVEFG